MKKFLTLFIVFISIFTFAQNLDKIIARDSMLTDSLQKQMQIYEVIDSKVEYLQKARIILKSSVNEVLNLENFNNKVMQKALLKPLTEYFEAFDVVRNKKKSNLLKYGFENKEDFIRYYKAVEGTILNKTIDLQYEALISGAKNDIKMLNDHINKNLKRLGISRAEYDALNENDRKLIEKKFE